MRSFFKSPGGTFGLFILLIIIFVAIGADFIAPHDPYKQNLRSRLVPPFWHEGGDSTFILGTDHLGRCLLSRIIYGARISLVIGISAMAVSAIIGTTMGVISGYYGGLIDSIIMRILDIDVSVPFILLAVLIAAALKPGMYSLLLVLAISGWAVYARVIRSHVLSLNEQDFVKVAEALGAKSARIILRHIIPNTIPYIIVLSSVEVARMIIAEASLSFLGLGIQPPIPAWGSMLGSGRDYLPVAPWIATFSGIPIVLTVLSINLVGNTLRDILDPTMKRSP